MVLCREVYALDRWGFKLGVLADLSVHCKHLDILLVLQMLLSECAGFFSTL